MKFVSLYEKNKQNKTKKINLKKKNRKTKLLLFSTERHTGLEWHKSVLMMTDF